MTGNGTITEADPPPGDFRQALESHRQCRLPCLQDLSARVGQQRGDSDLCFGRGGECDRQGGDCR
jgi:hypothetical protein